MFPFFTTCTRPPTQRHQLLARASHPLDLDARNPSFLSVFTYSVHSLAIPPQNSLLLLLLLPVFFSSPVGRSRAASFLLGVRPKRSSDSKHWIRNQSKAATPSLVIIQPLTWPTASHRIASTTSTATTSSFPLSFLSIDRQHVGAIRTGKNKQILPPQQQQQQ